MSEEGKKKEGMPTRRTGGIPRSPPETRAKIEEQEESQPGPSESVAIPPSPFSVMGIKKELRFTLLDEIPEELKPTTKEEERLQERIKKEMKGSILELDQWMTNHNLKFDLDKNENGEWNDEADV